MLKSIAIFFLTTLAFSADVDEIVEKANKAAYYTGKDGKAAVKMVITDGKGGTRERAFKILRLNGKDGDQKFYVYFEEPSDVRKMAYLVWKKAKGDDDRWLWLPALNLVKRIAPGDKRTSFVGSDFVYEDVSGRGIHEDTHEIIEETDTHWVLMNKPKDAGSVEFVSYKLWIAKDSYLPTKAEYTNKEGKVYRRVEALKIEDVQGNPTVIESKVSDLITGGSTVNTFSDVQYEIGLKDRIFTERFLRRPPREIR